MHIREGIAAIALLWGAGLLPAAAARAQEERSLDELLHLQVSTASKYEQLARRAPASVTVVTADDIARHGYRTLAEVLGQVPGFYVSYDRNYTYVGVRGFSRPTDYNNRLLLLVDGHTLNEGVYGSMGAGTDLGIDLAAVERIEIVRGPGAALYGTGAMLAVVNLILKDGRALGATRLELAGGSFGERRLALSAGAELASGVDLFASAFGLESDGVARGLDEDAAHGGLLRASYRDWSLLALRQGRQKGIPTGAFGTVLGDPDAETTDSREFLELKYERQLAPRLALLARGFVDHYWYDGTYPYDEATEYESTDNSYWGGELQGRWDPRVDQRLTAGIEYRRNRRADYRAWTDDQASFAGDFPFDTVSAYVQDEYQVTDSLAVVLGVRYDDDSSAASSTNPRAALVWAPGRDATLKLLYGRAFRAPNVYEVSYESENAGAKGNPDLRPETVATTEMVWEQRWRPGLFSAVSLYSTEFDNLIGQVTDPSDGLLQFRNGAQAHASGAELALNSRLAGGARLYGSYAYQRAHDHHGGELTNVPRHVVKVGGVRPLPARLHLAGDLLWESDRLTVQGTRTDSYWLANLTLSYDPAWRPLRLVLRLRNLFDERYATPGGVEHLQAAIPQDGRNWTGSLEWRF